jgi:SAM-dependent methyltransferase
MEIDALAPYERSLSTGAPLQLRHSDGRTITLDVARWLAPADPTDVDVIARACAPALDVGCGPGRIVTALTEHGRFALGIDIAEHAVTMTRNRGMNVLRRNVFDRLPGEGRWATVVLLDGNIGIGGDLDALLDRVRGLLAPDGRVLVEVDPDDAVDESTAVRFAIGDEPLGPPFQWCFAGLRSLHASARRCGLNVVDDWIHGGRRFAELRSGSSP